MKTICASCGSDSLHIFYEVRHVPVHSVLLMPTREEAVNCPKGDIKLGFCHACGFISNVAFNPDLLEYSSRYEETQGFSPTFSVFHRQLASRLVEKHDLHGKDIIEIGCGKGEFLAMLCELGGNRGTGFDPAFVQNRTPCRDTDQITFIRDYYSEKYAGYQGDFICCKMTLEHIQQTAEFVGTVRRSIRDRSGTIVFFQVPDVTRILRESAFWDIYYEHCSYFSPGSLARLFRTCDFDVIDLWKEYDDQYLMIEGRPGPGQYPYPLRQENDLDDLLRLMTNFSRLYGKKIDVWKQNIQSMRRKARKIVIWGAGSKGVAFLTALNLRSEVEYAIDINPHTHGTYMAGTGQKIESPEFLCEYKPDVVIAMNPVYREEIRLDLERMDIKAQLITV